ncbi:LPS export ABC transporter periplasmic protein LptC [Thiomicrorhabdus indica]|uniref:LPS export ABC transporter periplasmic protein LptC n=1 Tax=Thiomicrorhabdus indica TaxID=2267253 RepID=UPI00102DE2B0|nr:LPS export ABC transporter periplasmic protein LptC [Thiomicrorhabdus indica]
MHLSISNRSFKGILLPLLFASIALWASTWLTTDNDSETNNQESNLQGLEWKAEKTTLWSIQTGGKQTLLNATNIQSEQKSSLIELTKLSVTHFHNSQISYGNADQGILIDSQLLSLVGDVTLEQKQPQPLKINTQKLDIDLNNGSAQTDLVVKILQSEITTTATGMQLNSETGILELQNAVHSIYTPSEQITKSKP